MLAARNMGGWGASVRGCVRGAEVAVLVPALVLADLAMGWGVLGVSEGGPWGRSGSCDVLSEAERGNGG